MRWLWRHAADWLVPPHTLTLAPRCAFHGNDRLLRRFLENGALT